MIATYVVAHTRDYLSDIVTQNACENGTFSQGNNSAVQKKQKSTKRNEHQ